MRITSTRITSTVKQIRGEEVFRWNTRCYVDSYTAYAASIMAVEDEIRRHQLVVKALEAQRDCIDSFEEVSDD